MSKHTNQSDTQFLFECIKEITDNSVKSAETIQMLTKTIQGLEQRILKLEMMK